MQSTHCPRRISFHASPSRRRLKVLLLGNEFFRHVLRHAHTVASSGSVTFAASGEAAMLWGRALMMSVRMW